MPHCFDLTRNGEQAPESLNSIDRRLCEHLNAVEHKTRYVAGWYSNIGFALATGSVLGTQALRQSMQGCSADLMSCLDYLEKHYTARAWRE